MKLKRKLKWTASIILFALILCLFIAYWSSTNECNHYAISPTNPMKAIVYCEYGPPEILQVKDIEKPTPKENEVLVRVRAASLNPADSVYTGRARIVTGLRRPKSTRFGIDYAGTVETVGKNVTRFKSGDDVFGSKNGAAADYVCVAEDRGIVSKPPNISFEQAAAVGVAGVTALQGLRDKGKIQSGEKVLVNGASGGVGTFAVQIAKSFGTEVTGVCSTRNVNFVQSIGADRVIDYTKEDFTKSGQYYDLIFDLVGNHSFLERRRILNANGICVMAGIGGSGWHEGILGRLGGELYAYLGSRLTSQKFLTYLARINQKDLSILADLMRTGKVTPVIDKTFPLIQTPDAVRYLEAGHARGKVVITVE